LKTFDKLGLLFEWNYLEFRRASMVSIKRITTMKTLIVVNAVLKLMPILRLKVIRVKVMTSQILRIKMMSRSRGMVTILNSGNINVVIDVAMIQMKVRDLRLC
jgi:hypothetical protein